jgi:hypothetical protein
MKLSKNAKVLIKQILFLVVGVFSLTFSFSEGLSVFSKITGSFFLGLWLAWLGIRLFGEELDKAIEEDLKIVVKKHSIRLNERAGISNIAVILNESGLVTTNPFTVDKLKDCPGLEVTEREY